jgi:hypothetical protein
MRVALVSILLTLAAAAQILLVVIVEVVLTMLVYVYLNLYHIATFGYLVRIARSVLEEMTGQLEYWMPATANAAYATLLGELGPKSILLLMLGLMMSAIIRAVARLLRPLTARRARVEV